MNRQTNTATSINIILMLHMAITSIPPIAVPSAVGKVPMDCQAFSGPWITVSAPVWGSTETEPSIMVIITVIRTGITRAQAIKM